MSEIEVAGIIATTALQPKYGGMRLERSALESMGRQLLGRSMTFPINHNPLDQIEVQITSAEVVAQPGNLWALRIRFTVDEDVWAKCGHSGLSFAFLADSGSRRGPESIATLAATRSHFDDEALERAAELYRGPGSLHTAHLMQFSDEIEAVRLILEVAQTVGLPLILSGVYDSLKYLLLNRPPKDAPPVVEIRRSEIHTNGQRRRSVTAYIRTDDPEVLRTALEGLEPLIDDIQEDQLYDAPTKAWRALDV